MDEEVTGKADFNVGNNKYQTWYKIVGDLASGAHPLVMLHGGSIKKLATFMETQTPK
ncbi:hypothetical protein DEU56DRAFT_745127 [Suillus clintonianus]|uniref:uncharacterized protein n=1 Tax=Suillus clintonianus TaxID=1904413 RepID=UPI001B876803|nr:uncharacterized protein DEU56DRAFT_745127 [Suillus clintonianus]KAG2123748.1 hypothetical protein DEU56DRAFT_745127 [Suillus clintonianus]